ncbi:MAG: universal stress protein [Planctomycetes bacterium]|nr:universal stress protein [Planctomycetota bacterium]
MTALKYNSVLVPSDFSDQAHDAVDTGLAMAGEASRLTVIHVAPPLNTLSVGDPAVAWQTVSDETRSEHLYHEINRVFRDDKYKGLKTFVAFGNPADEITRYAEKNNVDLIVLPSHGRTGLARLMIGSVAERVVRLAHCPVLVLRQ